MSAEKSSPLEDYSQLLSLLTKEGFGAARAAEIVAGHMAWHWDQPTLPYGPTTILQEQWCSQAWRRFEADNPTARQVVAAHYLFRAASREQGAVRALLMERGASIISDVVNAWLNQVASGEPN